MYEIAGPIRFEQSVLRRDAMLAFESAVSVACERANRAGFTDKQLAEELRCIANELDPAKAEEQFRERVKGLIRDALP